MCAHLADAIPRTGLLVLLAIILCLAYGSAIAIWGLVGVLPLLIAVAVPICVRVATARIKPGTSTLLYWLGALLVATAFSICGLISHEFDCYYVYSVSFACIVSALTQALTYPEINETSGFDIAVIAAFWGVSGFLLFSALTLIPFGRHTIERSLRPTRILLSLVYAL
jgi:hypothetical protein